MKFQYVAGLCVLLGTGAAYAVEPDCPITGARSVLDCALKQNSAVLSSSAAVSIAEINRDLSKRYLNPSLELTGGYGNASADERGVKMGIAVMQTFETSDKRRAKINRATAELEEAIAGSVKQKEITAVRILTVLNRLRQIDAEKSALDETIATFSDIIGKYNAQSALSYEDKISGDLFKLALNNYKIEKNQLEAEERNHIAAVQNVVNAEITASKLLFFYAPAVWPEISRAASFENSSDIALKQAEVNKSKADFLDAKTSNFDSFSIGPYFDSKPGKLGKADEYGLKLSVPLPIYPNKTATDAGKIAYQTAERNLNAKRKELTFLYDSLREQYNSGTEALKAFSIGDVEQKHKQTEQMFHTGRVGNSVLIETHRQLMDSIKIHHQYELETLRSLWQLYALQGKLLTHIQEVAYAK